MMSDSILIEHEGFLVSADLVMQVGDVYADEEDGGWTFILRWGPPLLAHHFVFPKDGRDAAIASREKFIDKVALARTVYR